MFEAECVKTYALKVDDNGRIISPSISPDGAAAESDKLARLYMQSHPHISYAAAATAVLVENPQLQKLYAAT